MTKHKHRPCPCGCGELADECMKPTAPLSNTFTLDALPPSLAADLRANHPGYEEWWAKQETRLGAIQTLDVTSLRSMLAMLSGMAPEWFDKALAKEQRALARQADVK